MFFFRKEKSDIRLVFDVDSHSIRALIFEVPPAGGVPKVIKKMVVKLRIASGGARTAEKMRELMLISMKILERVPEEILVSIGPSLAEYKIETWNNSFDSKPKVISPKELELIFSETARQHGDSEKAAGFELAAVEANGYPILPSEIAHTPLTSIAFRVFLMFLSEEAKFAFADTGKIFGGIPLRFVPSLAVFAKSIAATQKLCQTLVVEVNDAETLIMAFNKNTLAGFSVFPFGAANFARRVAERRNFAYQEAKDTIRQASFGIRFAHDARNMEEIMASAGTAWKNKFLQAMNSLYSCGPFSGDVLLLGEGAYIIPIRAYLNSSEWFEGVSYAATPRLRVLDAASFFDGNTFGGVLQGPEDAELAALVHYSLFHKPLL